MAFPATSQKCTACSNTVYLVDRLAADNRIYHKACFRCHHCNGTLKLGNFNSFEGVLYCKPHYNQLIKRTGSLDKSFEGAPKMLKPERTTENEKSVKVSNLLGGTRDKCVGCDKTVYPTEKVTVNGTTYHKSCFKCSYGGCTITPSNYIAYEGVLYCKHHHIQLVKSKGNYSQLESDLDKEQLPAIAAFHTMMLAQGRAPSSPSASSSESPPGSSSEQQQELQQCHSQMQDLVEIQFGSLDMPVYVPRA